MKKDDQFTVLISRPSWANHFSETKCDAFNSTSDVMYKGVLFRVLFASDNFEMIDAIAISAGAVNEKEQTKANYMSAFELVDLINGKQH